MDLLLGALVAFVAFCLGRMTKRSSRDLAAQLVETERRRLEAEARYLESLQRELGQLLLRHDREGLLAADEDVEAFRRQLKLSKPERTQRAFEELTRRYPTYDSFDLIQLKVFVPVDMSQLDLGEVADRYADLGRFLLVMPDRRHRMDRLPDSHFESDRRILERVVGEQEEAARYQQEVVDHWTGKAR